MAPTWRVGKNYSRICPACPRTPAYCLNSLVETTQFTTSDTISAIYETQCEGTTPITPVNWYRKDATTGNWLLESTWTPPQAYPTAMEAYHNPLPAGCYKVVYGNYSTEFVVGTATCVTSTPGKCKIDSECVSAKKGDTCLFGGCYYKNDIYMAVGGFFLFMMMMKMSKR